MNPEFLNKIFEAIKAVAVQPEQLIKTSETLLGIIKEHTQKLEKRIDELGEDNDYKMLNLSSAAQEEVESKEKDLLKAIESVKTSTGKDLQKEVKALMKEIKSAIKLIPEPTDLSDLEKKIEDIKKSIPKIPEIVERTPEEIRDLLESLEDEDRLDAKAIKNLPLSVREIVQMVGGNVEVYSGNTKVGSSQRLRFSGANVTVDADGAIKIVVTGGTGGGHVIQEEGTPLPQRANLNFVGSAVTVTDDSGNDATVVTIDSGSVSKSIAQNSHGFSVGNWLYLNSTTYTLADKDAVTTAEAIGIVSTVTDANNFIITTHGYVTGLTSLTAGTVYFIGDSGAMTATEPTTTGMVSKPVFVADSTTSGYVINYRGLLITPNDNLSGSVTTTNNTQTTIATVAIPSSTTVMIKAHITARRTGGSAGTAEDGAAYIIAGAYKNVAGTATEISESAIFTAEDQAGWNATINVSSGNALIQVTGATNNNIDWTISYNVYIAT